MITKSGLMTAHRFVPSSEARFSLARSSLRLFVSIYRSWIREAKVRQAIRELEQLGDHALKDIGLQRGSIEAQLHARGRKQK